ncbi:hypothetical protein M8542_06390 [Amycolatopsis sp. OK19-0408]|uniref:Uncharacterized protein n=1 Tax=Amycolatopsis iheyensis TaxID=2945988 RepID=A0A9X2SH71_9PSEU|nr:hypothetical protein [Amycolatopsis iheyensis]MCR6482437.1 hypothetical protein [Amycolatopsis iheyensis]
MKRFFGSAFGVAVLGCLVLAGWAVWSAGVFDAPVAQQLRTSSVYAAPGVAIDQAAAERVIGNRRLVVAFLEPGADLSDACDSLTGATDGTLGLLLSRDGDDYQKYGCSRLPGYDDENFGKAYVAESMIGNGLDGFTDRPVDALKVAVVNYDLLVRSGAIPDGGRTVSPSLPRYLIAAAAVLVVLLGSAGLYLAARRTARVALDRRERRDAEADERAELAAVAAVLAQQIIDLDRRFAREKGKTKFTRGYRHLVSDYASLLPQLDGEPPQLRARADELLARARKLAQVP